MKKVFSMMIALVLLMTVALGYTLTINYGEDIITREVDVGSRVNLWLSERKEAEYTVVTNNVSLESYGKRRQFEMPAEDVEITITDISTVTVTFNSNGGSDV